MRATGSPSCWQRQGSPGSTSGCRRDCRRKIATATEQMFQLLKEGGLSGRSIAEANDALTMLPIGSIANDLTRPPQIREKLGTQLAPEDTPVLRQHMQTYATRDGSARYKLAISWILDGVLQAEKQ